jgi:ubiquinone/menaquinone biosynthesis C-methylase UbiE
MAEIKRVPKIPLPDAAVDFVVLFETIEHHDEHERMLAEIKRVPKIPLPDAAVDFVVLFETIERHDEHERMLAEIKRVLKPDSMVIVSSPDMAIYTDKPDYHNPFHVKELYGTNSRYTAAISRMLLASAKR